MTKEAMVIGESVAITNIKYVVRNTDGVTLLLGDTKESYTDIESLQSYMRGLIRRGIPIPFEMAVSYGVMLGRLTSYNTP